MKLIILKPEGTSYEMYDALCEKTAAVGFQQPGTAYCKADTNSIAAEMRRLSKKCDILIVTGEMGSDGCARQAAALAFGHPVVFSDKAWSHIQRKCSFTGEDPTTFSNCAYLPEYSMPVGGSGVVPACFSVNDDLALLMFDEKRDQKLLERFEALLVTLADGNKNESKLEPAPVVTVPAVPAKRTSAAVKTHQKRKHPDPVRSSKASKRRRYIKRTRRNAMAIVICAVLSAILLIAAVCSILSDVSEIPDDKDVKKASATVISNKKPKAAESSKVDHGDKEEVKPSESVPSESSSKPSPASQPVQSSQPASSSSAEQPQSVAPVESQPSQPSSSAAPVQQPVPETPSVAPVEPSQPAPVEPSSQPEQNVVMEYTYTVEEEEDERPSGSTRGLPKADMDAFDEKLSYTTGNGTKRMNAYDLVCQILMNETNGLFEHEALKAHAVATYSMLKYNNERGTAPSVLLKDNVTESIEDAVGEVLGVAAYYNGEYANTVYHSTSSGKTTSSESVWGGYFPYLVSVKSKYDSQSPYYETHYTVDADKLARLVDRVYGIELDGDPDDWFEVKHDAPGGYVGTVIIGGETRGQGGTWGRKEITGRSFRENLLSYSIRSHCFDIEYDDDDDEFRIVTYGYGHGVGMSQYGAHFMAQQGYNYVEILEHYYTGVEVY